MVWALYSLIKGRNGRMPSEFSVASISADEEWRAVIDCPNYEVAKRLNEHFGTEVWVRQAVSRPPHFFSYRWKCLETGSEAHFREKLNRLHWLDLVAVEIGKKENNKDLK